MYSIKKTERVYEPISSFYNLVEHFAGFGDRIAYRYFVDGGKNLAEMTYGEFAAMVRDEAAGLSALGLAGRRVAVIGETSPEWVATFLAIVTSGGVAVPMDKELAIPEIGGSSPLRKLRASCIPRPSRISSTVRSRLTPP